MEGEVMGKNKLSTKNARLKDLVKAKKSKSDDSTTGDGGGDDSGGGFQNYFLGNLDAATAEEIIGKDPKKARHFEKFLRDIKTDASELQKSELADIVESDDKAHSGKKTGKVSGKGNIFSKSDRGQAKQAGSDTSAKAANYGWKATNNAFGSPIHNIAKTKENTVNAKRGGQQGGVITGPHTFHEGSVVTTKIFNDNPLSKSQANSRKSTSHSTTSPKRGR